MSADGLVRVERLWKRFRPGQRRMLFRDELERLRARRRGEVVHGWRWALRDVDMQIEPGTAVGLFGSNGSGKSTLLKILTGVMFPYAGRVDVRGRVGALIEVSTGIHPDLTGRENLFLYGSIIGLKRKEVTERYDEIVAFAELEDAMDRQVKFYSSGMKMRLGFAVAAFLDPDVLLVDEVLAVGDASFQQKCLDRMRAVIANGTTLVFVSHDLQSIEATCSRGIWLDSGIIRADAPIRDALGEYRRSVEESAATFSDHGVDHGPARLVLTGAGDQANPPRTGGPLTLRIGIDADRPSTATLHLGLSEGPATPIFSLSREVRLPAGTTRARCDIAYLPLPRGRYFVWGGLFQDHGADLAGWRPLGHIDVEGPDLAPAPRAVVRLAPVHVDARWAVDGD